MLRPSLAALRRLREDHPDGVVFFQGPNLHPNPRLYKPAWWAPAYDADPW